MEIFIISLIILVTIAAIFTFAFDFKKNSCISKVFNSFNLIKIPKPSTLNVKLKKELDLTKKINIDEIYINTSPTFHGITEKLITYLMENYTPDEISNMKISSKGSFDELPYLMNNLNMNNIYLFDNNCKEYNKVKKIAINIGANPLLSVSTMNLKFEKDFDLTRKINIDEIYINTAQNYHHIIEKLITYFMENYTPDEISNIKVFFEGNTDDLPLNLKNAIGNNFKVGI